MIGLLKEAKVDLPLQFTNFASEAGRCGRGTDMPPRVDLQAKGDRDLRERLLADDAVTTAIERLAKKGLGAGRVVICWRPPPG